MGGIEDAFKLKNEQRLKFKLDQIVENPSLIIGQMAPATPPPNPIGKKLLKTKKSNFYVNFKLKLRFS